MEVKILLPTAYVVRQEGYVLTRVCPSVCPNPRRVPQPGPGGVGGTQPVQLGVGTPVGGTHFRYPHQTLWGVPLLGVPHLGYPCRTWGCPCWGVPHLGYPLSGLARGYPWPGVSLIRLAGGTLVGGYSTLGTPIRPGWGGVPLPGVIPQVVDGVLDTPRSVCSCVHAGGLSC